MSDPYEGVNTSEADIEKQFALFAQLQENADRRKFNEIAAVYKMIADYENGLIADQGAEVKQEKLSIQEFFTYYLAEGITPELRDKMNSIFDRNKEILLEWLKLVEIADPKFVTEQLVMHGHEVTEDEAEDYGITPEMVAAAKQNLQIEDQSSV